MFCFNINIMNYQGNNSFPGGIANQSVPNDSEARVLALKPYPVFSHCSNPNCNNMGPTKINSSINTCSCITCIFCPEFWLCYNACTRREMTCKDADHYCLKCGTRLGTYSSC